MTGDSHTSSPETEPPGTDEVELSLFGPGFGEALVLHLGAGDWVLVDSCTRFDSGVPAAVAYLRDLGVSPDRVRSIVGTHWHDDHIDGLGMSLDACPEAEFCCSIALRPEEFLTLVEAAESKMPEGLSGVSELAQIIATLRERKRKGQRFATPKFALEGRPLWERTPAETPSARITALSPSDGAVALAMRALAELVPGEGDKPRRVQPPTPNHSSVALWVEVGSARLLLGADLEGAADSTRGWLAVLDAWKVNDVAQVFKVAHHGSEDADEPRVWAELLTENPVAMLTPFLQGNVALPKDSDRDRICSHTDHAYLTSSQPRRRRKRHRAVQRTIKEIGVDLRDAEQPTGHVRVRRSIQAEPAAPWTVELFGPAVHLCTLNCNLARST